MARAAGARVIAIARSARKAAQALALGAAHAVDTSEQEFAAEVNRWGCADVVLDMAGSDYLGGNLDALKTGGRILSIAALRGNEVVLLIMTLMQKRAVVTGSTMRGRDADEKAWLAAAIEDGVWPWIENRLFRP